MKTMHAQQPFCVVFDLDGTLIDAMPALARELAELWSEMGGRREGAAEFRQRFASRFDEVFTELAAVAGRSRSEVYAQWSTRSTERITQSPTPFSEVDRMLASLRERAIDLYLWTTRPAAAAESILTRIGWERCFVDRRFGDSAPPKPAPDALVSMLGARRPRRSVAIVGDGVSDIAAGRAFGCYTVGAAWCELSSPARLSAAGADLVVGSPRECTERLLGMAQRPAAQVRG